MHLSWRLGTLVVLIIITPLFGRAFEDRDPVYMGKPIGDWVASIHDRNQEMDLAFAAIRALGPDAESAIPELVRILEEPFIAIRVGMDNRDEVEAKVSNIQLRAEAVEALIAIGPSAAPGSSSLIKWALTVRVVPMEVATRQDEELFIDLVAIDVLERMRVAGAVASFEKSAFLSVAKSLASQNDEERKLAVAILSEHAAPIAASLLKSENCESRRLGISIFADMWPVVSADHLKDLLDTFRCGVRTGMER